MKKYIIGAFILLVIVFAVIIAFMAAPEKKEQARISQDKIMYFYSDTCGVCIKQKPIIEELEKEGVQFEKMNVGEHQEYISQYEISGTPSFIFKDKRLSGFQSKETIKKLWEENK